MRDKRVTFEEERDPLTTEDVAEPRKKSAPLHARIKREYAELYRGVWPCAQLCCSWRCGCCLFFLLFLSLAAVIVGAGVSVINAHTGAVAAILFAQPTIADAFARETALGDEKQNWCALPVKMLFVPPSTGRLVLIALNGTGGNELRRRLELATRVTTSVPQCFHGLHFKQTKPIFNGECTGLSFSANHLVVKFWDWDAATAVPHYDATRAIFLLRNPLDAAVAAYAELLECDELGLEPSHAIRARSADCDGKARPEHFQTPQWRSFALTFADWIIDAVNDTAKAARALGAENVMLLDYSDLGESALARTIEFARPIFGSNFAETRRMTRCADRAAELDPELPTRAAFEDESLRKEFCSTVSRVWISKKWGEC